MYIIGGYFQTNAHIQTDHVAIVSQRKKLNINKGCKLVRPEAVIQIKYFSRRHSLTKLPEKTLNSEMKCHEKSKLPPS